LRQTSHCAKHARGLAHIELMLFWMPAEEAQQIFHAKKS
jgi:hypothetical protein